MQVRDVDMNVVVGNLTRMLDRILGEDVVVELRYAPRTAYVRADPGMIEQVLLNLAVNARDAMPLGGHLVIETSIIETHGDPSGPLKRLGTWVCLQVTDTGSGIAAEHLPHIFEPFFTTKDVGKGTGLGLATSYGIVQQHGGWIEVDHQVDHGVITDIVMPDGMNGIELAERLRRSSPSLKVIFTSGYLADVSRDDIPSRATDAYLAKPFNLFELARVVRRTLDARETTGREESR
jgi:signal transduction histidine kinase